MCDVPGTQLSARDVLSLAGQHRNPTFAFDCYFVACMSDSSPDRRVCCGYRPGLLVLCIWTGKQPSWGVDLCI